MRYFFSGNVPVGKAPTFVASGCRWCISCASCKAIKSSFVSKSKDNVGDDFYVIMHLKMCPAMYPSSVQYPILSNVLSKCHDHIDEYVEPLKTSRFPRHGFNIYYHIGIQEIECYDAALANLDIFIYRLYI